MKFFTKIKKRTGQLYSAGKDFYFYCSEGVWTDMRSTPFVKLVKTLNLSVRAFFNGDIQTKACALTYRTMLAIVPALALILAIGRGFGLQNVLEKELIDSFGSQRTMLEHTFAYVDSYLDQSSEGVFLGIGIALLLWTIISILSSVEHAFNDIWGVKEGRSFWRKTTDYLAIFLILPVLMICASGIAVYVTTNMQRLVPFEFMTPLVEGLLDFASLVFIWLFFTGVYVLIPNTKVKFKNAFVAGMFAGTGYMILQWLFISGQIYVSKYNAIYGGIAFLPLLLIWLQLVWVICLSGGVICYASQNIFQYNFNNEINKITVAYRLKMYVAVMTVIVQDYLSGKRPPSKEEIIMDYGLPSRLVASTVNYMVDAGLLLRVVNDEKEGLYGYVPAIDAERLTVGMVVKHIRNYGADGFIPDFDRTFGGVIQAIDRAETAMIDSLKDTFVKDIKVIDLLTAEAEKANAKEASATPPVKNA
ncbi:MAG: YihY/virulence factor BrkB family protein [Muribaculaceae bacterium]|nr:YihY/virulence factor BrkB family protein [Muribaculaceae bacterium]